MCTFTAATALSPACADSIYIPTRYTGMADYAYAREQLSQPDVGAITNIVNAYIAQKYPFGDAKHSECTAAALAVFDLLTDTVLEETCSGRTLIVDGIPNVSTRPMVVYCSLTNDDDDNNLFDIGNGHRFILVQAKGRWRLLQAFKGKCHCKAATILPRQRRTELNLSIAPCPSLLQTSSPSPVSSSRRSSRSRGLVTCLKSGGRSSRARSSHRRCP